MKFIIISFDCIQNHFFQSNSKLIWFYETALCLAVENENIEIVKLLSTNNKLDVNIFKILTMFFI